MEERQGDLTTTLGALAGWAGYAGAAGPGHLAETLRKAVKDGLINKNEVFGFSELGKSGIPYADWVLTRKAALLLMTRCNKPRCIELTRKMADVFEQWLDRRQHGATFSPDALAPILAPLSHALAALTRKFDQQNEELLELRKEVVVLSSERGIISDKAVRQIGQQLRKIASLETGLPGKKMTPEERKTWRSALGEVTAEARGVASLPFTRSWKKLNPDELNSVTGFLELRLKRAEAKDRLREPLMDWATRQCN